MREEEESSLGEEIDNKSSAGGRPEKPIRAEGILIA